MHAYIRLQVAIPCHENWNKMSASEQGRFCQSCQKTVTDFSIMTDKEVLHYLSQKGTDVCGRFTNDQLNRSIAINHNRTYSWRYLWNIVLATFLTASAANAQTNPSPDKKTSINNKKTTPTDGQTSITVDFNMPGNLVTITGVIIDSKTNLPIPFATVYVKGTRSGVAADAHGKFTLNVLIGSKEMVLAISAAGFKNQEYPISNKTSNVSYYLDPREQTLGEVVVTGFPLTMVKKTLDCHSTTMGMLVARKEVDLNEK